MPYIAWQIAKEIADNGPIDRTDPKDKQQGDDPRDQKDLQDPLRQKDKKGR